MKKVLNNLHKPAWWKESAIPYAKKGLWSNYTKVRYSPSGSPTHVLEEDWDNLIILDACRYDQFKDLNEIQGTLEERNSKGSATPEFLRKNFGGEICHDTVYVTANPMYQTENLGKVFFDVIDVWESDWNSDKKTVLPSDVAKKGREAHETYPGKRLIIHFMQPHYPFIGESSKHVGDHAGWERTYRKVQGGGAVHDDLTVWELLRRGEVGEGEVWRAYNENLELVLQEVSEIIKQFSGKTVITSDHGNLVGEKLVPFGKPMYGHPTNFFTEELRKVPWLIVDADERKQVEPEDPNEAIERESQIVSERLSHLGYRDK